MIFEQQKMVIFPQIPKSGKYLFFIIYLFIYYYYYFFFLTFESFPFGMT